MCEWVSAFILSVFSAFPFDLNQKTNELTNDSVQIRDEGDQFATMPNEWAQENWTKKNNDWVERQTEFRTNEEETINCVDVVRTIWFLFILYFTTIYIFFFIFLLLLTFSYVYYL